MLSLLDWIKFLSHALLTFVVKVRNDLNNFAVLFPLCCNLHGQEFHIKRCFTKTKVIVQNFLAKMI